MQPPHRRHALLRTLLLALTGIAAACATGTTDGITTAGAPDGGGTPDAAVRDASTSPDGMSTGPSTPGAGDVIFVELGPNPSSPVTDEAGEYAELLNVSGRRIDLDGCTLDDDGINGDAFTIGKSIVVEPNAVVVFAKKLSASDNGGIDDVADAFDTAFSIANGGGKVSLICDGVTIDVVTFDTSWPYSEGVSMLLQKSAFDATANDDKSKWCAAPNVFASGQRGSPGSTADHCP